MMATKKTGVLVGIAAIAVIGVAAVLYFSQWPPSGEDATGAIGAAERYRAEQISNEDVKIEQVDLQAFLQTDEFDRLINDPEIRKALTSDAMQQMMANDAARNAFANDAVRNAFANDAVRSSLAQAAVRDALADGALAREMAHR